MAQDDFVTTALNNAKKTLSDVNNSNVSPKKSQFAPPPEKPYNSPSYAVARQVRKEGTAKSSLADEAHSAGQGIAERMKNEAEAKKSLQQ